MDILFLSILNGIFAGFLLRFAYKSMIGYVFSVSLMIVFSYLVWMILPYLLLFTGLLGGHGSGGHGWTISWNKIFLVVSTIHLLFFLIVLFSQKKKEHWIKLFISFCIALYAYQSIYLDRYIEIWKDKNISSNGNNHMYENVSDIHMKTVAANSELANYYKQEFDSAMMVKDKNLTGSYIENRFLNDDPLYIKALKQKYMYQRLMQLKEKKIWKEYIIHKIKQLLETNATLNQDVEFRITNKYMKKYPIIAATNVCSYPLIKEILENGTKLDTYALGKNVLFNAINLCDNVDIVRLLIAHGADIKETITLNSFQHLPYVTFLVEKVCHDNGQDMIEFLKELYEEGTISHDRYYNDEIIQNKLRHCNHDWNSAGGIMGLRRGFIYTNNYISKEKLKELFDDDSAMLELIDSLENIKIRDIRYNLKKFKEYEIKHMKVIR